LEQLGEVGGAAGGERLARRVGLRGDAQLGDQVGGRLVDAGVIGDHQVGELLDLGVVGVGGGQLGGVDVHLVGGDDDGGDLRVVDGLGAGAADGNGEGGDGESGDENAALHGSPPDGVTSARNGQSF